MKINARSFLRLPGQVYTVTDNARPDVAQGVYVTRNAAIRYRARMERYGEARATVWIGCFVSDTEIQVSHSLA